MPHHDLSKLVETRWTGGSNSVSVLQSTENILDANMQQSRNFLIIFNARCAQLMGGCFLAEHEG
jgi:hypothetical protein